MPTAFGVLCCWQNLIQSHRVQYSKKFLGKLHKSKSLRQRPKGNEFYHGDTNSHAPSPSHDLLSE
jgi:hypothetical protein